jgi:hypothetical protein
MEQRWLGRKSEPDEKGYDNYKFENTFRYMIRKTFVLSKKTYAILYDELHLRFLTANPEKILDQNRMYAGIGIHLDKNKWWRLEAGYMYQPVFENSPDADGKERTNHALRITLISEMPFKRQK